MFLTHADAPAVFVSPDRVWLPSVPSEPASVCPRSGTCAPVAEQQSCAPPVCPGGGVLLRLERAVADVDELPDDPEAFEEELAALRADPALAALAGSFGQHPDRYEEESGDEEELGLAWHQAFGPTVGGLTTGGAALTGAEGALGIRFVFDGDELFEDEAGWLETALGDRFGLDLRVHWWEGTGGQPPGHIIALGFSLVSENRIGRGPFVVPSVFGLLLPELGSIIRPDREPAFYVRMSLPLTVLLSRRLGVEARLSAYLVDEWRREETTEALLTASLSLTLR